MLLGVAGTVPGAGVASIRAGNARGQHEDLIARGNAWEPTGQRDDPRLACHNPLNDPSIVSKDLPEELPRRDGITDRDETAEETPSGRQQAAISVT